MEEQEEGEEVEREEREREEEEVEEEQEEQEEVEEEEEEQEEQEGLHDLLFCYGPSQQSFGLLVLLFYHLLFLLQLLQTRLLSSARQAETTNFNHWKSSNSSL